MKISIEMFVDKAWEIHIRYYDGYKSLDSDDLCDIPNKRRNAKMIIEQ